MQWSPINPALFATVDGTGRLDLWNLINDSEVPTASLYVDGAPALNKVRWTQSGHQLAVGDDQGKISLFDVNEIYANPRSDDWTKFVRVLQDLKQSSVEMDETVNANTVSSSIQGSTPVATSAHNLSTTQVTPIVASNLPSVKSEPNFDLRANLSQFKASPQTPIKQ